MNIMSKKNEKRNRKSLSITYFSGKKGKNMQEKENSKIIWSLIPNIVEGPSAEGLRSNTKIFKYIIININNVPT